MKTSSWWKALAALFTVGLVLTGCSTTPSKESKEDDKLHVVTSFSVIDDMTRQVGGEHVDVHNLVPVGQDPHEYDVRPEDTKKTSDADLFIYSGMNLEGGDDGWVQRLADSVNMEDDKVVQVTDGIKPMNITDDVSSEYSREKSDTDPEVNPHVFLDPKNGATMVKNVTKSLIEADPEHRADYEKNRDAYLKKIEGIDQEYKDMVEDLPKEDRVLVTSERAYQYLASSYGLEEGFIWLIDTEELGTPEQIQQAVAFVRKHKPKALFVETNVNPRPMETVSKETDVKIAGKLFSDELGPKGEDGDTYVSFLESNLKQLKKGLS